MRVITINYRVVWGMRTFYSLKDLASLLLASYLCLLLVFVNPVKHSVHRYMLTSMHAVFL